MDEAKPAPVITPAGAPTASYVPSNDVAGSPATGAEPVAIAPADAEPAPNDSATATAEVFAAAKPTKVAKPPREASVTTAIIGTVVIVVVLAIIALIAFLKK